MINDIILWRELKYWTNSLICGFFFILNISIKNYFDMVKLL